MQSIRLNKQTRSIKIVNRRDTLKLQHTGKIGPQGVTGSTGPQGIQGIAGATGPQGEIGFQGETGPQGETGIPGANGVDGPIWNSQWAPGHGYSPGLSVTLNNGVLYILKYIDPDFVSGTDNDEPGIGANWTTYWDLFLPQGPQGNTGPQGPTGASGSPASNIITSVNSHTGAIAITGNPSILVASNDASTKIKNNADYVADGTDDQVQIQAAIDSIASTGGTVELSFGQFNISSSINISTSNVNIIGQGVGTKLFLANSSNDNMIEITGSGTVEVKIRNLSLNGNKANNTTGHGIYITTPWSTTDTQHLFEDIYIINVAKSGIHVPANSDTRVMWFNRIHVKSPGEYGFYFAATDTTSSVTDSVFYTCVVDGAGIDGFYIGALNNHFYGCKSFWNTGAGYRLVGYTNYFLSCESQDNFEEGWYVASTAYGSIFTSCIADSNGQGWVTAHEVGIRFVDATQCQVSGGIYFNREFGTYAQLKGISLEGTTASTTVLNVRGFGYSDNDTQTVSNTSSGTNRIYLVNDTALPIGATGATGPTGSQGTTGPTGPGVVDPGANGILARTALNTLAARTLTGTTNQVVITNGNGVSGNPTFALPQDIHTTASPTFGGLTVDTDTLYVDATNNRLGLGTTTPLERLHIYETTDFATMRFDAGSGNTGGYFYADNAFGFIVMGARTNTYTRFVRNGTERIGLASTEVVLNTSKADYDFRVASVNQDNLLFADASTDRVGLITNAPTHTLTLASAGTGISVYNTTDQTTNYERFTMAWATNVFSFSAQKGGTGTARNISFSTANRSNMIVLADTASSTGIIQMVTTTSVAGASGLAISGGWSASSGSNAVLSLAPIFNQTSTAGYVGIKLNVTETATGNGTKDLLQLQVGTVNRFRVTNLGETHISSAATNGLQVWNTTDETTNYEVVKAAFASNIFTLYTLAGGTGTARNMQIGDSGGYLIFAPAASTGTAKFTYDRSAATTGSLFRITSSGGLTGSTSAVQYGLKVDPIITQTSAGAYTAILVDVTETSTGSGAKRLLDLQVATSSKFFVDNNGAMTVVGTSTLRATQPNATLTYNLGGTGLYWSNLYARTLNVNSTASIDGTTAGVLSVTGSFGFGTTSPTTTLSFGSTATGVTLNNVVDETTAYERLTINWSSNIAGLLVTSGTGAGNRTLRVRQATNSGQFSGVDFNRAATTYMDFTYTQSNATTAPLVRFGNVVHDAASGTQTILAITPSFSQTVTAGYTALLVNVTETTIGSGVRRLLDLQVGSSSVFSVTNDGSTNIGSALTSRSITPASTTTYNVGSTSSYFNNVYARTININSTALIDGTTAGQLTITGNPVPTASATYTLGTSSLRWGTIWAGTLNLNNASAVSLGEGANIAVGTATGTKIGTSATQKIGFYNVTPIAQQTGVAVSAAGIHAALVALGLFTA